MSVSKGLAHQAANRTKMAAGWIRSRPMAVSLKTKLNFKATLCSVISYNVAQYITIYDTSLLIPDQSRHEDLVNPAD